MPDRLVAALGTIPQLSVGSIVDILIVAALIYWLLLLIRGTVAEKMLLGIAILLGVGGLMGSVFQLTMLSWLIRTAGPFVLFGSLFVFQPELRRALEQVGRAGSLVPHRATFTGGTRTIDAV